MIDSFIKYFYPGDLHNHDQSNLEITYLDLFIALASLYSNVFEL